MATLLFDADLQAEMEGARGFLERQDLDLVAGVAGVKILDQAASTRPDILVLGDRGWDPWTHLDELRSHPELRHLRVLLVAAATLSPERREALLGASVALASEPLRPEDLSSAVAAAMNVPTRVTVRTRVAFELTGRTADNQVVLGRMLDISTGGFRLECPTRFEPGEILHAFFALEPGAPVIFATARIVHGREVDGQRFEHGLEFAEIRLDDRRRIAEFVYRQSGLTAVLR